MTEAQRDYLADLAGRKGVRIEDADDRSTSWASAKIEELKAMPDDTFAEVDARLNEKITNKTIAIIREVSKWTFRA